VEQDRISAARRLQHDYGGVIVLKGAGTIVASSNGVAICPAGNPGMASGGMGDTLTGIITALLAQGLTLTAAAETGVWVHAHAADLAAADGERGLLASDLITHLREAINV
jgi:NAD(P)H-hydrate epimerase